MLHGQRLCVFVKRWYPVQIPPLLFIVGRENFKREEIKPMTELYPVLRSFVRYSNQRTDKENPKVICKVIEMYENLLAYPGGLRQVPPPGICAEYAYILRNYQIFPGISS